MPAETLTTLDEVFKEELPQAADFRFSAQIAGVFDDMVSRSVPFYEEIQRMIAELAGDHAQAGTTVYDLGCSTGTTLLGMDASVPAASKFVGIDESADMLEKCAVKLQAAGMTRAYELQLVDLQQGAPIHNASVVVMCLTLQFIRPVYRARVVQSILDGLVSGGVLLLVEKIIPEDRVLNRAYINYYYEYKRRNQYSELEITQKREALENVLIPYKVSENKQLLHEAGFAACEVFFQWYNFSGLIALKK